jgi:hypothetical protein
VRVAELARSGRPLLLDLTGTAKAAKAAAGWSSRVDVVAARVEPSAEPGFTAALIRPDSFVAWATSAPVPEAADLRGLRAAGARWFGVE